MKIYVILNKEYAGLENWEKYIDIDKKYFRPTDIDNLVGDSSKAEKVLQWKPEMKYEQLIKLTFVSESVSFEKKIKLRLNLNFSSCYLNKS